ncbi:coproporphyrinogen III oxidase, partial [Thioclava sp. BHET1]
REGHGELPREALPLADQAVEYLMMSLRLREGSDLGRYAALSGRINPAKIAELGDLGMVELHGDRLVATESGRILLNAVLRELLVD